MIYAKQSTAIIVTVGPVLDADGVAVTGGVVADFTISKNGAAPAALNASATLTHRAVGFYSLALTATDVDTVGTVEIVINDTVNCCPMKEIQVVETTIYDALFANTANGFAGAAGASTVTFSNTSIATVTTLTNLPAITANWLTAAGTAADFGTEIAAAVWQDAVAGDFTVASSIGKALYVANIAPGASGGHFISGSNAGTTTVGALTVTGATTLTGNVSMAAGLNITQSSANTSALVITGNGTGHGAAITGGSGATGNGLTLLSAATNGHGLKSTGTGTGDGAELTAGASGADLDADIAGVLTTVTTATNVTTVNGLAANVITAAATAADFGTEIGTAVWVSATRTLTSLAGLTVDTVTTLTNLPAITANWLTAAGTAADFGAEVANAVWDEAIAGHLGAGSTGAALNAAGSAGDPWSTALPGAYGAGTAGRLLGRSLPDIVAGSAGGLFIAGTNADVTTNIIGNIFGGIDNCGQVLGAVVGDVLGSVGSVDVGGITAASFAANAITAAKLDPDVTTELQAGLATAANLATVDTVVDAIKLKTDLLPEAPAKNTAFTYVVKMVDATDGFTPETGLTVTMTRSLDGAAFGAATGAVTEISTGHYKVDASAADMNGDIVTHRFTAAGAADHTQVIQTTS